MAGDEFSVYWWDPLGKCYPEKRFVGPKTASECFVSMTIRPAAKIGVIRRVIMTDGGDFTCAEWVFGKGYRMTEADEWKDTPVTGGALRE